MDQVASHLSTGLPGLDRVLCGLIPGDNIVWQFDSVEDYARLVPPYCSSGQHREKRLVYFRFGRHAPLVREQAGAEVHQFDPSDGFETFTMKVHEVVRQSERGTWYVFDCLSELAVAWRSDTMLGNFFVLTCPFLYDVDAIAYFGLLRRFHAPEVTELILKTTQVFLDIYHNQQDHYVHPIKVQQRNSPTMYMLHWWKDGGFVPVADSATTAEILSTAPCLPMEPDRGRHGVWHGTFSAAQRTLEAYGQGQASGEEIREALRLLLQTAITRDPKMLALWERYLGIEDVLEIGRRIIGTGLIGGKANGMLLARAILRRTDPEWDRLLEVHDSFYIGSDVFYSFLVENGLWWVWQKHRSPEQLLRDAEQARRRIVLGTFPEHIQSYFQAMLHYFGQSPIIVRSSSLLEDSFGHSFAGKYDSVFLGNQGSPQQRLQDFLSAVRTVYASTLSEKALAYRARRGMLAQDEQMALLVQRVSGAVHERLFFPHLGGVGFSYNPYVWSDKIDPRAGVLRLVFGLGTRAVDRTDDDYPRVVALNAPRRQPVANYSDVVHYAQRRVDVVDLEANRLVTRDLEEVIARAPDVPIETFASRDERLEKYAPDGQGASRFPWVLTFDTLLENTEFVPTMRRMLREIEEVYGSPVDVEFTTNFPAGGAFLVNLVQCRPLQVAMGEVSAEPPLQVDAADVLLESHGATIGHGRVCSIDRIVYVVPAVYAALPLRARYSVARLVGKILRLEGADGAKQVMLLGPGRWGTSMPAMGVPVTFDEIGNIAVLSEIVVMHENLVPDVSLGTHFFNELVEADILYFAIFPDREDNTFREAFLEQYPNRLEGLLPEETQWSSAVRVLDVDRSGSGSRLILSADALGQHVLCYREKGLGIGD